MKAPLFAAAAAALSLGTASAAPCTTGTCEIDGGPLGATDVAISDENVVAGAYNATGSFSVAEALPANGIIDVSFDGGSGSVPAGFQNLMISFEQDAMNIGDFDITDSDGFQILSNFFLTVASTSDIFFEITGTAFNDGLNLPDYNVRLSSVPVPAALPLLLSGIAGLTFAAGRKKRSATSAR